MEFKTDTLSPEPVMTVMEEVGETDWFNLHTISMCLAVSYASYYLLFIVKRPVVSCNPKMYKFLETHCPILSQKFWPTIWCFEARMQTIFRSAFAARPHIPYEREMLNLPDGGEVALDWVMNDSSSIPSHSRPTMLIMPGLVGTSEESYARNLALESTRLGFRAVVFNYRGNGGASLKTSRTYCASETSDLANVAAHVRKRFNGPVMAVGISLGGIILTNYLAHSGKSCLLSGAMSVSAPWNTFESSRSLEEPINSFIFNHRLANFLKQSVSRHEHLFKDKCDMQRVYNCQTIRDFDTCFTAPVFGYDGYESYYHDACIDRKVHDVKVPLLSLNAADDPFSPLKCIPVEEARKSDFVTIIVTSRGGHIAFLDGLLGLAGRGYMERVFSQFFSALYHQAADLLLTAGK